MNGRSLMKDSTHYQSQYQPQTLNSSSNKKSYSAKHSASLSVK